MNTTYYRCKRLFSIVSLLTASLLLTACAGQQAAKELAGLEIASMLEYKQTINQSITTENSYYKKSLDTLSKNLSQMSDKVNSVNSLNYQAKYYNQLWRNTPPSQYNVLELIDAVYGDYEKTNKELDAHLKEIDELYFSKTEKLTLQQDNINNSIEALTKLYMGDDLKDQANLVKDYFVNTAKAINEATKK
ncbi:MAG: hypothetical protein Q8K07_19915 [Methylicorpusculum sp.]|uniref:hypothetical protein n=1 Tax=Pseudomonadota TaxID=1224 RepID=UPI002720A6C5|nr:MULTISPECIES: hypothetical protein [Pseudomonadota]MDO9149982.1 hypothetical protein [Methylotenera sp.]MDP2204289.1 hypothetical protein [Methylicorpusculum sp.]